MKNGTTVVDTLTLSSGEDHIWQDSELLFTSKELPKYDNEQQIVYTIFESSVDGYEATIDGYNITNSYTQDESTNPDALDKPDEPDKPDTPDKPDEPDKPGEPDKPDTPDKPGEPDKPNVPNKPNEPGKPSIPDNTVPYTVRKIWRDGGSHSRPDSIQIHIIRENDENYNAQGGYTKTLRKLDAQVNGDVWTWSVSLNPAYIQQVDEVSVPAGYVAQVSVDNQKHVIEITNTLIPQTGDPTKPLAWLALCIGACLGLALTAKRRKA